MKVNRQLLLIVLIAFFMYSYVLIIKTHKLELFALWRTTFDMNDMKTDASLLLPAYGISCLEICLWTYFSVMGYFNDSESIFKAITLFAFVGGLSIWFYSMI